MILRKNSRKTDRRSWYYRRYGEVNHGWGLRFRSVRLQDHRYREVRRVFRVLVWNR